MQTNAELLTRLQRDLGAILAHRPASWDHLNLAAQTWLDLYALSGRAAGAIGFENQRAAWSLDLLERALRRQGWL